MCVILKTPVAQTLFQRDNLIGLLRHTQWGFEAMLLHVKGYHDVERFALIKRCSIAWVSFKGTLVNLLS